MPTESFVKKTKSRSSLERVRIARHVGRPKGLDVLERVCDSFQELHGDRFYGDDPAMIAGLCEIGKKKAVVLAQQKGSDTKDRLKHNFGMMTPDGYRKALRAVKLAEKFNLPVLSIVDTPGAYPGIGAEKRGQARAIADNLYEMSSIKTPIISLILGEGCSGGAIGVGVSDKVLMLEHAYYSVISPEGCAAILWRDSRKSNLSAGQLKMQSENLLNFSMIDSIIQEGEGGFHENKDLVYSRIKNEVIDSITDLEKIPAQGLIERRYKKYRSF